ncbi:MAG: hypothetical protein AB1832_02150 [Pseudomonadota bacterium]
MRLLLTTHPGIPVLRPARDAARTAAHEPGLRRGWLTWRLQLDPVARLADAHGITRRFGVLWCAFGEVGEPIDYDNSIPVDGMHDPSRISRMRNGAVCRSTSIYLCCGSWTRHTVSIQIA